MQAQAPVERPHPLSGLVGDVEARAFSLALSAVAGGIALVAAAYAIYAGLQTWLVPAGAAAVTAAIFAALTAAIGIIGRRVIDRRAAEARARAEAARLAEKPTLLKAAGGLALAAITTVGEAAIRHKLRMR